MPSIDRPLGGAPLHFRLGDAHRSELIDEQLLARAKRSARTLVKDGPLRVTLVAIDSGGRLAPHRADGPITLHALAGEVRVVAEGEEWLMGPGDLVSLSAGVEHEVDSANGGVFLLTVVSASEP